jgi:type IV pilus assembly protein PilN
VIEINLLSTADKSGGSRGRKRPAAAAKAKVPGNPWLGGLGIVAVLVLVFLAVSFWRVNTRIATAEAAVHTAQQDSIRYAGTIELINALQAQQDTIEQQIEVIRSVDGRRYVWPHVLDEVSAALPPFTWLTELSARDGGGATPGLTIQGNAGSTQALTRFMRNLEESPFLRDVSLVTSQQTEAEGRTFHRFTVEARYRQPDSAFIRTEPVLTTDEQEAF